MKLEAKSKWAKERIKAHSPLEIFKAGVFRGKNAVLLKGTKDGWLGWFTTDDLHNIVSLSMEAKNKASAPGIGFEERKFGTNPRAKKETNAMIPKSTTYALTKNGVVTHHGSAEGMRKLLKKKTKEEPNVNWHVWNSPGNKIGQKIGKKVSAAMRRPFKIGDVTFVFHAGSASSAAYPWDGHQVGNMPMFVRGYDSTGMNPKRYAGEPGKWYTYGSKYRLRAKDTPFGKTNPRVEQILEREYHKQVASITADVIGKTRSGKPVHDSHDHASHSNFTAADHLDASKHHVTQSKKFENQGNIKKARHHGGQMVAHRKKMLSATGWKTTAKQGLDQDVFPWEDGYVHDGLKRVVENAMTLKHNLSQAGLTIVGNVVVADYMAGQKNFFTPGVDDNLTHYPEKGKKKREDLKKPKKPNTNPQKLVQVNQPTPEALY